MGGWLSGVELGGAHNEASEQCQARLGGARGHTYNGEAHAGQCSVQPSGVSNSASRLHTSAPACRTRVWWREIIARGARGGRCRTQLRRRHGAAGPKAGRELLSHFWCRAFDCDLCGTVEME